jgi:hypothetical protein
LFEVILAAAIAGCGHETAESSSSESFCEDGFAECDDSGECEFAQECVERTCHEEEGYEDDGDFYYKSRCTETTTVTEVFYPVDGGTGLQRTSTDTHDCRYKEEEDFWDYDYDESFSCETSSDVAEFEVQCEPVACDTCTPICQ